MEIRSAYCITTKAVLCIQHVWPLSLPVKLFLFFFQVCCFMCFIPSHDWIKVSSLHFCLLCLCHYCTECTEISINWKFWDWLGIPLDQCRRYDYHPILSHLQYKGCSQWFPVSKLIPLCTCKSHHFITLPNLLPASGVFSLCWYQFSCPHCPSFVCSLHYMSRSTIFSWHKVISKPYLFPDPFHLLFYS